ncbi:MAG: hypothetical protein LBP86_05970 [Azoarcus sp.]|jgi:hypothetical protein|nr:hypothetical protein [Azoarcus sp.]
MRDEKGKPTKKKVLVGLVCLWLPAIYAHAADDCPATITVNESAAGTDVLTVAPSGKECARSETHMDENEFRVRKETIHPDGGVGPQGEDTQTVMKKGGDRTELRTDKKDGSYGQFNGEWPDDEYTRRIPRPPLPLNFVNLRKASEKLVAMFDPQASSGSDFESDATVRKMRNYVAQLKARGFTEIVTDKKKKYNAVDYESFIYEAKDPAGYMARVSCGSGNGKVTCDLNLYAPKGAKAELERRERSK